MGKQNDLSALERGMVVGARHTRYKGARTATLLGFFNAQPFPHAYQQWFTTQRTSTKLDSTVGSIGVNMCKASQWNAVVKTKGGMQLNIRKVFLTFCTLCFFC